MNPGLDTLDALQETKRTVKPLQRQVQNSKARHKDLHHLEKQSKHARSVTAASTRDHIKSSVVQQPRTVDGIDGRINCNALDTETSVKDDDTTDRGVLEETNAKTTQNANQKMCITWNPNASNWRKSLDKLQLDGVSHASVIPRMPKGIDQCYSGDLSR